MIKLADTRREGKMEKQTQIEELNNRIKKLETENFELKLNLKNSIKRPRVYIEKNYRKENKEMRIVVVYEKKYVWYEPTHVGETENFHSECDMLEHNGFRRINIPAVTGKDL